MGVRGKLSPDGIPPSGMPFRTEAEALEGRRIPPCGTAGRDTSALPNAGRTACAPTRRDEITNPKSS